MSYELILMPFEKVLFRNKVITFPLFFDNKP